VLVVVGGMGRAGKGSTLGRLLQPVRPRGFKVHHGGPATPTGGHVPAHVAVLEPAARARGLAVYNHSWSAGSGLSRSGGERCFPGAVRAAYERIACLSAGWRTTGTVIVKFFLHNQPRGAARRFKELEKDTAFAWKGGRPRRVGAPQAVRRLLRWRRTCFRGDLAPPMLPGPWFPHGRAHHATCGYRPKNRWRRRFGGRPGRPAPAVSPGPRAGHPRQTRAAWNRVTWTGLEGETYAERLP
jgi:hypothetical protein